jgi:hypothetical protein
MTRRRAWAPFAVLASLALAALLLSGLRAGPVRAYAVGVPSVRQVAVARPHHQACEGLIHSQHAFQSVVLWGAYVGGTPRVAIAVERSGVKTLISGGLVERSPTGGDGQFTAKLRSTVAGDQRVTVCVSDRGGELKLRGSTSGYSGVSIAGSQPLRAFAMVALEPEQHSLLGSLGLAFSRASLFRPSWVRPWTFWILLILLLGTLPLAAVAIASAMRSESNDGDHA